MACVLRVAGGGQEASGHLEAILLKAENTRVWQLSLSRKKGGQQIIEGAKYFSLLSGIWYKM